MTGNKFSSFLAFCLGLTLCAESHAVYVSDDGIGQALIFPFYTSQLSRGDTQSTYISIANQTSSAKAIRVRFHEANDSLAVGSFNLFLAPWDMWTAAVMPSSQTSGSRIVSFDGSCVSAPFAASGSTMAFDFNAVASSFERSREGWIEAIEMATLTGDAASAVAFASNGLPANCAAVVGESAVATAPPTGGLTGTFTVINVASGLEFSGNPTALAQLSQTAFYRPPSDPYPALNASEIESTSVVTANGRIYRSLWSRPIDAVSAALMRNSIAGEFVLDANTRSQTDVVLTFPTRAFYVSGTVQAPFSESCAEPAGPLGGEGITFDYSNREGVMTRVNNAIVSIRCTSTGVFGFTNSAASMFPTSVLGSRRLAWTLPPGGAVQVPAATQNGWFLMTAVGRNMTSLATSTRTDAVTGATVVGSHVFAGYPVVGFTARTFENGTLQCSSGACQGNYGGAFPLKYTRSIN